MDPLSDVIALLRPSPVMSEPMSGSASWGVRCEASGLAGFTLILEGKCWFSEVGSEPIMVQKGHMVLFPSASSFSLSSHPDVVCSPAEPANADRRLGEQDGDPDAVWISGTFGIDEVHAQLLLTVLPDLVHVPGPCRHSGRVDRLIELILDECEQDEPGRRMVLKSLFGTLFVEVISWNGSNAAETPSGLLKGLRDPILASAIKAIHADVRASWTVAELAQVAGVSRSNFAARFGLVMGCGSFEYLTRWRMALAKEALMRGTKTLEAIAHDIGYESGSAFNTAFRNRMGISPGRFARTLAEIKKGNDPPN